MNSTLSLLFNYRSNGFRRYFKTNKIAKSITIAIFLGILFVVAYGIYAFFRWEFLLIGANTYLHIALPLYFYEGLLLVVFLLVFLSSFVSGMFSLFRTTGDAFVMASPRFSITFWRAYLQALFSSLWPIVVIMVPAFLGSNTVAPMGWLGSILFLISICLLAGLGVSLALTLFLVEAAILYMVSRLTAWKTIFSFGNVAFLGVLTIIAGMGYAWHRVGIGDITSIFAPQDSTWSSSRVDIILQRFSVFPSHLAALTYFSAQTGALRAAVVSTAALAIVFLISVAIMWVLSFIYLSLWQLFQEGKGESKAAASGPASKHSGPISFPRYFKSPLGALFEKEGLLFFREIKSTLWFFFLFALWGVQIVLEFFIRTNLIKYGENVSSIVGQIEALQLGTAIYFVSAFILRFVFPSFSGEQKTAWILGVSPLKMQSVFWSKLLFYSTLFLALGVLFCGVNFSIIQMPLIQASAFIIFTFLMIIFLVSLGLGLGAIFPNFESNDPETLSTSLPGLGFIFGSLLYGGVGTYLFYEFALHHAEHLLLGFDLLTAALTITMVFLSLTSLKHFEFVKDGE